MKYIIVISLLLISCSQDEDSSPKSNLKISASACAQKLSDGSIKECEPNKKISSNLSDSLEFSEKLNKQFPGPIFPGFNSQYKVVKATRYGILELENGKVVSLAGLKCDHVDLGRYQNVMLIKNTNSKITIEPTGLASNNIKYAYVWEVSAPMESSDSNISFGPSWSPINETAISSKWCTPIIQKEHRYHKRYNKIAEYYN